MALEHGLDGDELDAVGLTGALEVVLDGCHGREAVVVTSRAPGLEVVEVDDRLVDVRETQPAVTVDVGEPRIDPEFGSGLTRDPVDGLHFEGPFGSWQRRQA
jgi:hypothetical protein